MLFLGFGGVGRCGVFLRFLMEFQGLGLLLYIASSVVGAKAFEVVVLGYRCRGLVMRFSFQGSVV